MLFIVWHGKQHVEMAEKIVKRNPALERDTEIAANGFTP